MQNAGIPLIRRLSPSQRLRIPRAHQCLTPKYHRAEFSRRGTSGMPEMSRRLPRIRTTSAKVASHFRRRSWRRLSISVPRRWAASRARGVVTSTREWRKVGARQAGLWHRSRVSHRRSRVLCRRRPTSDGELRHSGRGGGALCKGPGRTRTRGEITRPWP